MKLDKLYGDIKLLLIYTINLHFIFFTDDLGKDVAESFCN